MLKFDHTDTAVPVRAEDQGHSLVTMETWYTEEFLKAPWTQRHAVVCECGRRYTSKSGPMGATNSWERHKRDAIKRAAR